MNEPDPSSSGRRGAPGKLPANLAKAADAFRMQSRLCAVSGSPIYSALLARAASDLEAGGRFAELVADYEGEPHLDALPLRILARVHALVLSGDAPGLAAFYPSAGGAFDEQAAWRALLEVAETHAARLRRAATSWRVQTNEVCRSAALLPGFLHIARCTGLPLRVREIGASAGLNLIFDRYRYALGPHHWGDPDARLLVETTWTGSAPDLGAALRVADRRGCDVAPIDASIPDERRRLVLFIWPEQRERLVRLRAALAILADELPAIAALRAGEFVARECAPAAGFATVLFHSVVWWYLPEPERAEVTASMEAAGAAASRSAPIAWLRLEGASTEQAELRLRIWPGGDDRLIATSHWHGAWVRWLG